MARWHTALRGAVLAIQERAGSAPTVAVRFGVVTAVTAGAARDGKAAVTVRVRGSETPAPYLDSYLSPKVGDFVEVALVDSSPLIRGRVVGFPSF